MDEKGLQRQKDVGPLKPLLLSLPPPLPLPLPFSSSSFSSPPSSSSSSSFVLAVTLTVGEFIGFCTTGSSSSASTVLCVLHLRPDRVLHLRFIGSVLRVGSDGVWVTSAICCTACRVDWICVRLPLVRGKKTSVHWSAIRNEERSRSRW